MSYKFPSLICAVLCSGILLLQCREGSFDDLSWFIFILLIQTTFVLFCGFIKWRNSLALNSSALTSTEAAISRSLSSKVAMAVSVICAFSSVVFAHELPLSSVAIIEFFVVSNFFIIGFAAHILANLSAARAGLFLLLMGTFCLGALPSFSFLMYLTPLPAGLDVISWSSSIGRESAKTVAAYGMALDRIGLTVFFQLLLAICSLAFWIGSRKGLEQTTM